MTDIVAPVPQENIPVPRGSTRIVRFTITKNGVTVNLSVPSTHVIFTAKRKALPGVVVIQHAYHSTGSTPIPGVEYDSQFAVSEIDTNGDTVLDTWVADLTIPPSDTDTITDVASLVYDVWLVDPTGQEVPVVQGLIRLEPTVYTP